MATCKRDWMLIYLNPDGTWTNGFQAWDDAVAFMDFGLY